MEQVCRALNVRCDALFRCRGRVAVVGIGKSADVGQKLVGTLNSTGTRWIRPNDSTYTFAGPLTMISVTSSSSRSFCSGPYPSTSSVISWMSRLRSSTLRGTADVLTSEVSSCRTRA